MYLYYLPILNSMKITLIFNVSFTFKLVLNIFVEIESKVKTYFTL